MRRKRFLLSLGMVLLFLGAAFGTLLVLLKHEPTFYRASTIAESDERSALSSEFVSRFYSNLMNSIYNRYPDWWEVLTTEQINAFLQQDFQNSYGGDNNLPDGFHDLRVQVEEGKLRIGCRYGKGFWSTVLSIEVKMWLVANEVNLIGIELVNLRAGGLPVSRQIILDFITETARRSNIEVKWFHRKENLVAILKLQADQIRPTIQIQRFELQPGKIVIVGRSTDGHASVQPSKSEKH